MAKTADTRRSQLHEEVAEVKKQLMDKADEVEKLKASAEIAERQGGDMKSCGLY